MYYAIVYHSFEMSTTPQCQTHNLLFKLALKIVDIWTNAKHCSGCVGPLTDKNIVSLCFVMRVTRWENLDWIYMKFYVGLSLFTFSCNITHSYTWNELNSSLYLWIFCLQITGKLYYSSNIPQTSQVWSCKASSNWQQKYIKNKSATHVIW